MERIIKNNINHRILVRFYWTLDVLYNISSQTFFADHAYDQMCDNICYRNLIPWLRYNIDTVGSNILSILCHPSVVWEVGRKYSRKKNVSNLSSRLLSKINKKRYISFIHVTLSFLLGKKIHKKRYSPINFMTWFLLSQILESRIANLQRSKRNLLNIRNPAIELNRLVY